MYEIVADLNLCQGYGNCVGNAPEIVDLDDNDTVTILRRTFGEDELPQVRAAVASCPVSALAIHSR